jgi:hypothetical protein
MWTAPAALAVVLILVACTDGGPVEPEDATAPASDGGTTVAPTGPTADVEAVLEAIVVAESDPPTGTGYFQSFHGAFSGTQMIQESATDVQTAALEGWEDALTREFASPETAEVILGNASPTELDPEDHHFLGSIASAYRDAASARAALGLIVEELSARIRRQEELALADGGVAFRERFLHVSSVTLLWTSGRFLLVLSANGMDDEEVRAIAEDMNARVPSA